jgi:hypothetical protein
MFIRSRNVIGPNGKKYTYYAVVESVRIDGKPRQQMIYNMGKRETIAACIAVEQAKINRYPTDEKQIARALLVMGVDIGRYARNDPERVAELQKRIERLKDIAAKLNGS